MHGCTFVVLYFVFTAHWFHVQFAASTASQPDACTTFVLGTRSTRRTSSATRGRACFRAAASPAPAGAVSTFLFVPSSKLAVLDRRQHHARPAPRIQQRPTRLFASFFACFRRSCRDATTTNNALVARASSHPPSQKDRKKIGQRQRSMRSLQTRTVRLPADVALRRRKRRRRERTNRRDVAGRGKEEKRRLVASGWKRRRGKDPFCSRTAHAGDASHRVRVHPTPRLGTARPVPAQFRWFRVSQPRVAARLAAVRVRADASSVPPWLRRRFSHGPCRADPSRRIQ